MSYNNTTSREFLRNLTLENCPQKWIENAKANKDNLSVVPEDFRELYRYILINLLSEKEEPKTTSSKKNEEVVEEEVVEKEEEVVVEEEEEDEEEDEEEEVEEEEE